MPAPQQRLYSLAGLLVFLVFAGVNFCHGRHLRYRDESSHPANPQVEAEPVTISWHGTATSSTDPRVARGSPCILSETVARKAGPNAIRVPRLALACAGRTIYEENRPSLYRAKFYEAPAFAAVGAYDYTLYGHDDHFTIDTPGGAASVQYWHIGTQNRIDLSIAANSAIRRGLPLFEGDIPPFRTVVHRTARAVPSPDNWPPSLSQSTCELDISPAMGPLSKYARQNCRVRFSCDGKTIIGVNGQLGFRECHVAGGAPVTVEAFVPESDGGPPLTVDIVAGTADLDGHSTFNNYHVHFVLSGG